jgi:hypothetical protein
MKKLKYVKLFENFYDEQSSLLNENNNTLIINSLSKRIYDDLSNQGYKVLLNTTRTSTGHQLGSRTHEFIGTRGIPGSYDSADFYIQVLLKSLEITFHKKQYVSDDNELRGVLDVLKEKYTSDEIQSGWDGDKLIFATTS